jgi:hypothetical protein
LMSTTVVNMVATLNRRSILGFWAKAGIEKRTALGARVEDLFWSDDLARSNNVNGLNMTRYLQTSGKSPGDESFLTNDHPWVRLQDEQRYELQNLASVFTANDTVVRMKQSVGVVDFAGPGRKVYQVTTGTTHRNVFDGWVTMLAQAGYLLQNDDGTVTMNTDAHSQYGPLELYWVVPVGERATWSIKSPYSVTIAPRIGEDAHMEEDASLVEEKAKTEAIRRVVKECFEKHVIQYALVMDF